MENSLLTTDDLTIGIGGRALLRPLNITVAAGQRLGITGPSGCGKTTLLRTIAQLIDPIHGAVQLRGESPRTIGYPAFRRQVVLVDQRPAMLDAGIEENLRRPFTYRHAGPAAYRHEQAADLLDQLGIGRHRLAEPARSLSVGEQQRVALVRALLIAPAALLLDEPTSALDDDARARVQQAIESECRHRQMAVIAVLHDTKQAEAWCDRTLSLNASMLT